MRKIELGDFDDTFAIVRVGEGDECVTFTFRQTIKGIRRTATSAPCRETRTYVPKPVFMAAYRKAVGAILQARQEKKNPHFLARKLGER